MVEGISGWVGWMIAVTSFASGLFCIEGPDADVVGTNGCSGVGSGAAGWITDSRLGGGGDGVGEWLGVIGLVEIWSSDRSWICGGESS